MVASLWLPLAVLLGLLPLAIGQDAVLPPAPPPPPPDATRLAYETSDSDELLPPLSSYFPPGTLLGNQAGFALGTTSYRCAACRDTVTQPANLCRAACWSRHVLNLCPFGLFL